MLWKNMKMNLRNLILYALISAKNIETVQSKVEKISLRTRQLEEVLPPPPPPLPKPLEPKGVGKNATKILKDKTIKSPPPPCDEEDILLCPSAPCPANTVCPPPPPPHCCPKSEKDVNGTILEIEESSETNGGGEILQFETPPDPILYTGKHSIGNPDLIKKVIDCVTNCSADCGMYAVNNIFFDGVLNVDFTCIESCMDEKAMNCSNIKSCQVKCSSMT